MSHVKISEQIGAPVEDVFAYVDDHTNTIKYMKNLTKWAPAGSKTHGKGAKFQVAMKAGPLTLASIVDITTWTDGRAIGWTSIEGFKQKGKWTFTSVGAGTEATFEMDFELPGGFAGRLLARAAEPVVHSNIAQSVKNLKSHMEDSVTTTVAAKKATAPRKR